MTIKSLLHAALDIAIQPYIYYPINFRKGQDKVSILFYTHLYRAFSPGNSYLSRPRLSKNGPL
jgi:hypothetical protein